MSAVIPWIGEPPDSIHLEAREKITSTWLRDAALGELITQAPWVVDGITDAELEALDALDHVSRIDPELVEAMLGFPWVADGVDFHEQPAFVGLLNIGGNSIGLMRRLSSYAWVAGGQEETETLLADVFDRLRTISDIDRGMAVRMASAGWVADGVNPTELVLLSVLPRYFFTSSSRSFARPIDLRLFDAVGELNNAWTNQTPDPRILDGLVHILSEQYSTRAFNHVISEPWLRNGLDAMEAARTAIFLATLGGWSLYWVQAESPLVPSMTISLPLAGDVRVWLVNANGVAISEDAMLEVVGESARFSEELLRTPFPTTDIIIDILDSPWADNYGHCRHHGTHIRWSEDCGVQDLARLVAQYYFNKGNSSWLNGGAANVVQGYVADTLGVETIADRRARLSQDVTYWAEEEGLENVAHFVHYDQLGENWGYPSKFAHTPYQLGEHLLHNLTDVMGQDAMSAALRELHIPARTYFPTSGPDGTGETPNITEEGIYDIFLKYTSPGRKEEVQDVYSRLHGGAFVFPNVVSDDDHGDHPLRATEFYVGQAVEGSLDYPVDLDFFRFTPERDGKYIVNVDHESLGVSGLSLYLYHYSGAYVNVADDLVPQLWTWKSRRQTFSGPQILWMAPSFSVRYFAVENFGGETGPYTLTITKVEDVEDDHGDSLSNATDISLGASVAGVVDDDFDFDYFRFEVAEGRKYQIEVMPGTLQYFRTRLFTSHNTTPGDWSNVYPDDEADGPGEFMRTWRAPDSGVYYFAVDGYNENLGTYTIRITDLGG